MNAIISTIRAVAQKENWSASDITLKLCDCAEAAEARADEYAESCGGKVHPNDDETWVECVNRLAGELASRDEREHAPDIALSQERDELAAQLAHVEGVRNDAMIPCATCGGSGFSKPGSGYDAVCDDCSGGYVGYATGEMINQMQDKIDKLQIEPQRIYWMTLSNQHKADAMRFETERDAAIDSAEYYKHTHLSMQTTIDNLAAQLATAQADIDAAIDSAEHYKHTHLSMQTTIDSIAAQLERVTIERDAAREFLSKIISMEENNGVLNGVWINLENARKAAGIKQP